MIWLQSAFTRTTPPSRTTQSPQNVTTYHYRAGSTELRPRNANSQSCSLLHFSCNSQAQTADLDGAGNPQETQEMRYGSLFPPPISPPPSSPSPLHPNTNPWLRLSALCPHPSPLCTLLPVNRAVFPCPQMLPPPSSLLSAFQSSTSSTSPVHFVPPRSAQQEHDKAGSAQTVLVLSLIRCISLCQGSWAKAPLRWVQKEREIDAAAAAQHEQWFWSNTCPTAQKPLVWCWPKGSVPGHCCVGVKTELVSPSPTLVNRRWWPKLFNVTPYWALLAEPKKIPTITRQAPLEKAVGWETEAIGTKGAPGTSWPLKPWLYFHDLIL